MNLSTCWTVVLAASAHVASFPAPSKKNSRRPGTRLLSDHYCRAIGNFPDALLYGYQLAFTTETRKRIATAVLFT